MNGKTFSLLIHKQNSLITDINNKQLSRYLMNDNIFKYIEGRKYLLTQTKVSLTHSIRKRIIKVFA